MPAVAGVYLCPFSKTPSGHVWKGLSERDAGPGGKGPPRVARAGIGATQNAPLPEERTAAASLWPLAGVPPLVGLAVAGCCGGSAASLLEDPFGEGGAKHNDFLDSKNCFADTTSSVGSSAADLDLKSSSSHSGHSSEISLPEIQKDKNLEEFSLLKLLTKDGHRPEWTFYPRFSSNLHTYHVGKQCFFDGVFLGNRRSLSERTMDKYFGRKKYDIDPRNGIPKLTPGDNPYMYPEQSKDFHKAGSTLPPVNFSVMPFEKKFDTFIPLEPLPQIPSLPFWVKEKENRLKNEIREVEELEKWQAASPLTCSLLLPGSLDITKQC